MFSLAVDVICKASGQEYATSNKVLEESKVILGFGDCLGRSGLLSSALFRGQLYIIDSTHLNFKECSLNIGWHV